jgi:predicted transcriptional regulator
MSMSPQDICEKFIKLTKDKSRLLVGLSTIDEKERLNIDNVLKLIEQKTILTEKKSKHQKEDQLLLNKDFINKLKKNLRANIGDKYIRYHPANWSEINKITKLDVKKDIKVIKEVHSMVTNNKIKANAFASYEACHRGKLYFKLKSKFSDNKAFIHYCD